MATFILSTISWKTEPREEGKDSCDSVEVSDSAYHIAVRKYLEMGIWNHYPGS